MRTKRVSLVTCVYQRRELTRAFWTWMAWLRQRWAEQGIQLEAVAAASDPVERDFAQAFGVRAFLHANHPLGAKFNAALAASEATDPDWVLIMGSDDFFCGRAADALAGAIRADRSVGFQDLYYADLPTGRVRYLKGYRVKSRHTEPVGPGTLHSRAVCERFHWRLWDATQHHGMDNSRFRTLKTHGLMPDLLHLQVLDAVMLDVKTGTNLWPFDRTHKQPVLSEAEGRAVWARLPEHVLRLIPWPQAKAVA
jgi:hypothetical protein